MSILQQFLLHPRRTGAVAASSRRLARAMTDGLRLERARTVVELGPGTGAVTEAILSRAAPGTRIIAVELNGTLAGRLAERYRDRPVDVVHASAADLARLVRHPVDAVVSGLPWTVIAAPERHRILNAVAAVLAPAGVFATFAYAHAAWTPPGRRFAAELAERFGVTTTSPVVWRNLPPAFVHRAAVPTLPHCPAEPGEGVTTWSSPPTGRRRST